MNSLFTEAHVEELIDFFDRELEKPVRCGAEIGVYKGRTSNQLLSRFPELRLFCVDYWDVGDRLGITPRAKKSSKYADLDLLEQKRRKLEKIYRECVNGLVAAHGDRAKVVRGLSIIAAEQFRSRSLDFVFIDAAHDFQSVLLDLYAWEDKVRSGGIVSGHDYCGKFLSRKRKYSRTGVEEAVEHFCQQRKDIKLKIEMNVDTWWYRQQ